MRTILAGGLYVSIMMGNKVPTHGANGSFGSQARMRAGAWAGR